VDCCGAKSTLGKVEEGAEEGRDARVVVPIPHHDNHTCVAAGVRRARAPGSFESLSKDSILQWPLSFDRICRCAI
jgi:hypothetical protein